MGPIVLLKNFTFAMASGQTFLTDWIAFPSEYQNATLHVHLQTLTPTPASSGMTFQLQTSFDTVEVEAVGSAISLTTVDSSNSAISSNLASLVRLLIQNDDSNQMFGIVSVWLQPKSE